jgi:nicotinamide riboside kinase
MIFVTFVGPPCSGKTTTAAGVFTKLKEDGIPAELLTEHARIYIAQKKYLHHKTLNDEDYNGGVIPFKLDDTDQLRILEGQCLLEQVLAFSAEETGVVVCDTSVLNTLLYMSNNGRHLYEVKEILKKRPVYTLTYFVPPHRHPILGDPNRIHTYEQALEIHSQIPEVVKHFAPEVELRTLAGGSQERIHQVVSDIYEEMGK